MIFVHGAGYLHNVHNFWSSYSREYMFHHFLASKGYVVLDIDYRAVGRLRPRLAHRDLSRDGRPRSRRPGRRVPVPAQGPASRPSVSGIYGGSYGGFITLMALFTRRRTSAPAPRCDRSRTGPTTTTDTRAAS